MLRFRLSKLENKSNNQYLLINAGGVGGAQSLPLKRTQHNTTTWTCQRGSGRAPAAQSRCLLPEAPRPAGIPRRSPAGHPQPGSTLPLLSCCAGALPRVATNGICRAAAARRLTTHSWGGFRVSLPAWRRSARSEKPGRRRHHHHYYWHSEGWFAYEPVQRADSLH